MKQTIKAIFRFDDVTETRKAFIIVSLVITMLPGLTIFMYNLLTDIEGPNPFLIAFLFMGGLPLLIFGLAIYILSDTKLKRKLIITLTVIVFQISILPAIWLTNDIKLNLFFIKHKTELEFIANNIIDKKWTLDYATEYTASKKLPIRLFQFIEKDKTVLFFISGIIDNCSGIAYSVTGNEATQNDCGRLVSWKQFSRHWYEWGTT